MDTLTLKTLMALAFLCPCGQLTAASGWREDFIDLRRWQPLTFPKIKSHSSYQAVNVSGMPALRCESKASASGLLFKQALDVRATPWLRFEWRVENIYPGTDPRKKAGDDYPLRIYIFFPLGPQKATLIDRLAKAIYGSWPPHSSLNYVWSSRPGDRSKPYPSPYTGRLRIIALEGGSEKIGQWVKEEANILEDYRLAFGHDPPTGQAQLAVMSDSDNSKLASLGWIRKLELSENPPP